MLAAHGVGVWDPIRHHSRHIWRHINVNSGSFPHVIESPGCVLIQNMNLLLRPFGLAKMQSQFLDWYSLRQVASNSDYLVFQANFMEGPSHTEPVYSFLLLCSTQRHQTWNTEGQISDFRIRNSFNSQAGSQHTRNLYVFINIHTFAKKKYVHNWCQKNKQTTGTRSQCSANWMYVQLTWVYVNKTVLA